MTEPARKRAYRHWQGYDAIRYAMSHNVRLWKRETHDSPRIMELTVSEAYDLATKCNPIDIVCLLLEDHPHVPGGQLCPVCWPEGSEKRKWREAQ